MMGVSSEERRKAEKERSVRARKAGNPKANQFPLFTLTIPTWVTREITKTEDKELAIKLMKEYEFEVKLTKNGILYKPIRLNKVEGW